MSAFLSSLPGVEEARLSSLSLLNFTPTHGTVPKLCIRRLLDPILPRLSAPHLRPLSQAFTRGCISHLPIPVPQPSPPPHTGQEGLFVCFTPGDLPEKTPGSLSTNSHPQTQG